MATRLKKAARGNFIFGALFVSAWIAGEAHAGFSDAQWVSLGAVPGTDGTVEATVDDAQGDLYIGGTFGTAGNVVANFVAKWDGSSWSALGSGMNDVVDSLAVSEDGDLYAGGSFTTAGGVPAVSVAKWNGTEWSALGSGISGGYPFTFVHALVASGKIVYAGGNFTTAGGAPASNIAKWDGNSWSTLGSGVNDIVYALRFWNSNLYAAGSFTWAGGTPMANYVAEWKGSAWSALGTGVDYGVTGLAVWNNSLYVAGNFSTAFNSDGGSVPAHYIAQWNGTAWSALGTGADNTIHVIAVSSNCLYAGGIFDTAGGARVNSIAQWDGNAWSAMGSGIGVSPDGAREVKALAVSGNILYAGGHFNSAGGASGNYIAQWKGGLWAGLGSDVGLDNIVYAVAVTNGNLYAAGGFTFAGGVPANRIAQWNGNAWTALGLGMDSLVYAVAVSGSNLYAGGNFTWATNTGGSAVQVNRVAQWDGTSWLPAGGGMNSPVYALAVSGTNLYAGGDFVRATNSGGIAVQVNCIARWNGNSWSSIGPGVSGNVAGSGPSVRALAVSGGNLYAAGRFASAGGVVANNIAKWDGNSWSALGLGTSAGFRFDPPAPPPVSAIVVYGANVYAAGTFTSVTNTSGMAVPANHIAQWNGTEWSALGSGLSGYGWDSSGQALAVACDGNLYVAGLFNSAGGVPANYIAQWDGGMWSPLGSGISAYGINGAAGCALTISGTSLFVGGYFTMAGTNVSAQVAEAVLSPPRIMTTNSSFGFTNRSGEFGFEVSGGALQRVVVEGSTNLMNWVPLQTNLMGNASLSFSDPSAPSFPQRFYRVMLAE